MGSASNPPPGLAEGQVLAGKYRLVRRLGAGGMCLVFEAEHIHLKQAIAIKVLKPELAEDPTAVARFAQEAQAAAKLRSPNVARVYDVDRLPDGQPYITMELLVGHDLGTELSNSGALPMEMAVDYVVQAANGIAEAHALGIIHRDLKPENLFLTELGPTTHRKLVKILDFGIAKNMSDASRRLTAPDAVFGTVDYMSPEQIRSASTVDHRSDLWSLGVILYELLTGATPYQGDARSVIAQIVSDPVVPPTQRMPNIPPSLVAIVMKALAKDPAARFQTAEELREALVPYSGDVEPITGVLARLPPQSMPRRAVGQYVTSDPSRDMRTNLSFETASPKRGWGKRLVLFPLLFVLVVAGGVAYWKRDALKMGANANAAAATPPPPAIDAPPEATPPAEPAATADPPPETSADVPAAPETTSSPTSTKRPGKKPRPRPTGARPSPSPPPTTAPTLPKHL